MIPEGLRSKIMAAIERKIDESFYFYSNGMTPRYRQSLRVMNDGRERIDVVLDYTGIDGDEPLGIWFEYGTRRHWVEPKVKHPQPTQGGPSYDEGRSRALLDPDAGPPRNPKSRNQPQALSWLSGGKRFFSMGHWVSGIEPRLIITNVKNDVKLNMPGIIKRVVEEWQGT